jgi:hypothetical protein
MTVNKYFTSFVNNKNEQDLIDGMYAECIQIRGLDVWYIRRASVNEDYLFGEDPASAFEESFEIEMYMESFEGFGTDTDLMSRFGLHIKDRITLNVNGTRFFEVVGMKKPLEGDLIWFPLAKALFDIRFVEDEDQFFALGKTYNYKIQAQLFEYSHEDMATGIEEVDDLQTALDDSVGGTDPYADNDKLETEGDTAINFDETNPFGSF